MTDKGAKIQGSSNLPPRVGVLVHLLREGWTKAGEGSKDREDSVLQTLLRSVTDIYNGELGRVLNKWYGQNCGGFERSFCISYREWNRWMDEAERHC